MKKVNLIGTIINSIRLAHLKLDRINNGGLCFSERGLTGPTKIPIRLPIHPSIPYKMKIDLEPIILDQEYVENRKRVLKKAGLSEKGLLESLALIEIDNERECVKNGGRWLETRSEAEKVYLIPSESLKKENHKWFETMAKLESNTYNNIGKLINILDLLVEERIEPRMINGKEERIKFYRDRLILDKDLDSLIIKTKRQIMDLFLDLDSYFLILFSIRAVGQDHVDEIRNLEGRLKDLKSRGK